MLLHPLKILFSSNFFFLSKKKSRNFFSLINFVPYDSLWFAFFWHRICCPNYERESVEPGRVNVFKLWQLIAQSNCPRSVLVLDLCSNIFHRETVWQIASLETNEIPWFSYSRARVFRAVFIYNEEIRIENFETWLPVPKNIIFNLIVFYFNVQTKSHVPAAIWVNSRIPLVESHMISVFLPCTGWNVIYSVLRAGARQSWEYFTFSAAFVDSTTEFPLLSCISARRTLSIERLVMFPRFFFSSFFESMIPRRIL